MLLLIKSCGQFKVKNVKYRFNTSPSCHTFDFLVEREVTKVVIYLQILDQPLFAIHLEKEAKEYVCNSYGKIIFTDIILGKKSSLVSIHNKCPFGSATDVFVMLQW